MTRLLETHAPPERMDIQRGTGENDGSKGPKAEKVQRERIQWQSLKQPPCANRPIRHAQMSVARHRTVLPAAVVATYLAIGLVAYWPVLPGISSRLFGRTADYVLSAWFVGWVPHAIAHGLNPFFTNAMFVPTGVNLAQNTESPLLGLLGAPLTEAFSPLVTTNVLMVLAMPVSATAAFVVLRKWKVWLPGAALGGLVYGFSPYMVGQGADHLVFTFVPIPPFIALTIVSILQRKGAPWRLGIQLGLLVVAQYFISQEVAVDVAILTLAALVCVAVRHPNRIQEMGRAMVRPVLVALPVIAVLLAYPVWMLVAGPQHSTVGAYPLENPFSNDLLTFFVPGPLQHVSFGMGTLGDRLIAGPNPVRFGYVLVGSNPVEYDGYIGVVGPRLGGLSHVALSSQPTDAVGLRVVRGRRRAVPRPLPQCRRSVDAFPVTVPAPYTCPAC